MQKIVILGTGGTIAGRSALRSDNIGYVAAQVDVEALLVDIPGLAAHVTGYALDFEQVAQVDSKDMNETVWCHLAQRTAHALAQTDVQSVVITHGTDTIEETAFFLQSVLSTGKPVVLTCAMRPASALSPDGPQNLLDALSVAMDAKASGVQVVRSTRCPLGQVIPAPDSTIAVAQGLSPVKARVALQLALMGLPPAP